MSFIQEFKEFAIKGNAVDMAVAVVIGGAFGKIVSSIVDDLIMPIVGVITGGVNFTDLKYTLKSAAPAVTDATGQVVTEATEAVTINYGNFIQTTVDFLIIAFCIFLVIKGMNSLKKEKPAEEVPAADPVPTKEEVLLTEIRDLLKNK
ncbi:MAG: large-conductance mechanosensitive channel protein MscL [Bacteroidales bacterium]|nr:large-conductance mechanosensitive channel protein MscL [Bacteroidales bacterium]